MSLNSFFATGNDLFVTYGGKTFKICGAMLDKFIMNNSIYNPLIDIELRFKGRNVETFDEVIDFKKLIEEKMTVGELFKIINKKMKVKVKKNG